MKVEFLRDYQEFKAGDVVELSEAQAEDLHSSAVIQPYQEAPEPAKAEPKKAKK